ncbi:12903_t:CDS:2, partial [Gigaspora rosea]
MNEFEVVQGNFVKRLEEITFQKVENNKKTKRNHNNTIEEHTESGLIDSTIQTDKVDQIRQQMDIDIQLEQKIISSQKVKRRHIAWQLVAHKVNNKKSSKQKGKVRSKSTQKKLEASSSMKTEEFNEEIWNRDK